MTNPLVSVVTPTRNMGDRLRRCVDSVANQSHPNVEHIVIDACSTDDTVAFLESQKGLRWISEADSGQSDGINKGLRLAAGDILGWLNADDELTPGAIAAVVAALRGSPDAGLVYGDLEIVGDQPPHRVRPLREFTFEQMWLGNPIYQPGTFWTRWAQQQLGLLDDSFHYAMDFEYWLRFAKERVQVVYVPEVLARFEIHEGSKTGTAGGLAFAEEEARALRLHGDDHGAATLLGGFFVSQRVQEVAAHATAGRTAEAAALASETLVRMGPALSRSRLFLRLAKRAPSFAARLHRRAGRRPSAPEAS